MFFDSPREIEKISNKIGCAVFVMPADEKITIKNAIILQPEDKTSITIEQVRALIAKLSVKQVSEQYIIIRPADALGEEAANAFLKNLEEPKDRVHYILITDSPSKLLPTILSRSEIYFLKNLNSIEDGIKADDKTKELAKRLIAAKPAELSILADEITRKKDGTRVYALMVLGTAIEILYKSYFITHKEIFIKKLPNFLSAYENIEKNGHIKLHIVADLC